MSVPCGGFLTGRNIVNLRAIPVCDNGRTAALHFGLAARYGCPPDTRLIAHDLTYYGMLRGSRLARLAFLALSILYLVEEQCVPGNGFAGVGACA